MKRLLRFSLLSLMALMCSTAFGQTVTDELTAEGLGLDKGTTYKEYTGKTVTSSAVYYLQCATGTDGNTFQLRSNNSNSGIVTTASGGKLKSITLKWNDGTRDDRQVDIYANTAPYTNAADLYNNTNPGTLIASVLKTDGDKTITVDGDYAYVGLRSKSGALYLDAVIVEWEGSNTPQLTISGATPFTSTTTVTITPSNADNDVYYTLDGSDPKSSTTRYTAPFTLSETTTVKAYEENAELTAEKTFTKEVKTYDEMANIAAFKALETGKEAKLMLNNAQVVYANGNDVYVRDASGAVDFYNTGITFTVGQNLNGFIIGKKAVYGKIPELAKTDDTKAADFTATAGTATAKTLTIAAAKADANVCDLVKIENVKMVTKQEGNYTNTYAYIGTDSILTYDKWKLVSGTVDENKTYTLEGILIPYNDIYEIYPTVNYLSEGGGTEITKAANIAAFKALDANVEAELTLTNAQVVYTNGQNVYVRDASGAIDFYNTGLNLEANKMLNGTVILKNSPYRNLPEAVKTDKTNADNLTITDGEAAQPKAISVADVQNNLCDLVQLTNVKFAADGSNTVITDATGSTVTPYNTFKIADFNDFSTFVGETSYVVTGIAYVFNTTYQIAPITISDVTGINTIDNEQETINNGAIYNLAGQRVDESYKGVVIKNGKKYLNK